MPRYTFHSDNFYITHTIEEEGPHPTIPSDHYDENYSITIIFEGSGICSVEGTPYPLSPGTILVISPDEIRYFQLDQVGRHERMTLYFSEAIATSLLGYEMPVLERFVSNPSVGGNWFSSDRYDRDTILPIIEQIRLMLSSDTEMKGPRLHLLILQLLFALYDSVKECTEMPLLYKQDVAIQEICKYIKTHLNEDLSHQFFKEHFFVSHHQLTKKFRQQTGMTLIKYINTKRLVHAVSLIRTGQQCETAAYNSGFNSYCHFYKEFVKFFGTSPTRYFKSK